MIPFNVARFDLPSTLSLFISMLSAGLILSACSQSRGPSGDDDDDSALVADDDDSAGDDDDSSPLGDDDDSSPLGDDDDTSDDVWLATASMYAHTADDLYSVEDTPPYAVTHVSTFSRLDGGDPPSITDLAVSLDGAMYGVSTNGVWHIAPATGVMEAVLETQDEFFVAMTFLADGSLLVGGDANLYEIDLSTGTYSTLSSFVNWGWDGDMVGLPDGFLYCIMRSEGASNSSLVIYDAVFNTILSDADTGVGSMFGVAYGAENLFGFTDGGQIVTIDAASGVATQVASPDLGFWGAATNPVLWSFE
jgi:hypothetical protein